MIVAACTALIVLSGLNALPEDPGDGAGAMAPSLFNDSGRLHLTWLEPVDPDARQGTWRLQYAALEDEAWSPPTTVAERDDFFINWADTPRVCAQGDTVLVTWLQMSGPGAYSYDIHVGRSIDGGSTFEHLGPLHSDGVQAEHGFVSLAPEGDGFRAVWLDGRDMGDGGGHGHDDHTSDHGTMSLRTTVITDSIGPSTTLDPRVCECCGTALTVNAAGPVILYRDRSDDERRDISVIAHRQGQWTDDQTLHHDGWIIAACPVNGPAIDSTDSETVCCWFTGAPDAAGVHASFLGDDHGVRSPSLIAGESSLGRVDVAMTGPEAAVVTWIESSDGGGVINGRMIHSDGSMGRVVKIADVSDTRQSGFPRTTVHAGHLLVALTEPDRRHGIALVLVPLSPFLFSPPQPLPGTSPTPGLDVH